MPAHFSRVQLCAMLYTLACQAPLSMGLARQEYWSGLPGPPPGDPPPGDPSPGDLPNPGIKPGSPALQAFFTR